MVARDAFDSVGRKLPHGWSDFLLQIGIWLGFVLGYLFGVSRARAEEERRARRMRE